MSSGLKKSLKNRLVALAICLCIFAIYYIFQIYGLSASCIFKKYLKISCPACGLTRAFKALFKFDIYMAFKYNILSIPVAVILCILIPTLIYDVIFGKDIALRKIKEIFCDYYILIILGLGISFVYNNVVGI